MSLRKQHAIILALLLAAAAHVTQSLPMEGASQPTGQETSPTTPQCNPAQFVEFETKQTHCFAQAELAYNETVKEAGKPLEGEAARKAACKSITEKVKCITEHLPLCHTAVQTEAVKDQYLISEFTSKYHDQEHLKPFDSFVASCPVLKDNEANVVKLMTGGPNDCSFSEIQRSTSNESLAAWAKCNVDTVEEYNKLLADLDSDTNEKVIEAYCSRMRHYETNCRDPYVKCQSPDAHTSLRQSEKALFDQVEQLIKGHKLADFSFDKSCAHVSS